jgi:hypothetical protein
VAVELAFEDFDGPGLDWLDFEEEAVGWELDLDCETVKRRKWK